MISVRVQVPYASFRKSYARSFAESYPFPPPATVYGMLLSLVESAAGRATLGSHSHSRMRASLVSRPLCESSVASNTG